ncbi:MAG: DNA-3-methyladenine glycosylase 2 family protein [Nitrospirota bacterium]|nr:DNA-3-methyladenine glycosylase 2 family protein [Nitrospirota bacterium]
MRTLIDRVGPCDLVPRRGAFAILCNSIISQQLSIAAATTIFDRLASLYPARRLTPMAVLASTTPSLRAAGLSQQKVRYVQGLAVAFQDGRVQSRRFSKQSNEEIIAALTSIKGIGRWTVEMFLIFSLNRPDVLPVDDLGIRQSVQRWYRLSALPSAAILKKIAEPWHPYESIASWYLWKARRLLER